MSTPVIGFAGLTHLGLVSAIGAASKGFSVVGFDADATRIAAIRAGRLPVVEPRLDELAGAHAARLTWSDDPAALGACDIVYISTDVPTDDAGCSDLGGIGRSIESVLPQLGATALLVILCQVPPGYTRGIALAPARLYYQVETLIFGRAVERATEPERFIVGCADPSRSLPPAMATYLGAYGCPILPMRYESAELSKIAINCCLVASVTVANTLAELSEGIGADWAEIAPALRLDRRIGQYSYLTPGLGLSGGNLERDLATVLRLSEKIGSDASLITAFLRNSAHRRDWPLRTLQREVLSAKPDAALGVLGLAYKENTHSTKNSPSLALIAQLPSSPLRVFDPVVPASALSRAGITGASTALDAAQGVDALLVMTPWPEFRALEPRALAAAMSGTAVIDPYRLFDPAAMRAAGLSHFTLGKSAEPAAGGV